MWLSYWLIYRELLGSLAALMTDWDCVLLCLTLQNCLISLSNWSESVCSPDRQSVDSLWVLKKTPESSSRALWMNKDFFNKLVEQKPFYICQKTPVIEELIITVACFFSSSHFRTVSTFHALLVGIFCLHILLFDDAVNEDPVWWESGCGSHVFNLYFPSFRGVLCSIMPSFFVVVQVQVQVTLFIPIGRCVLQSVNILHSIIQTW